VERLVARMLAKNPEDRPRDAAEVAAEIERLSTELESTGAGSGEPLLSPPSVPVSALTPSQSPTSLTLREQRLVTVVLAGAPDAVPASARVEDETLVARELTAPEVERFGGHLSVLTDGSMLVTIWGTGSVVDRVERAARCALALRARFAGIPICVV